MKTKKLVIALSLVSRFLALIIAAMSLCLFSVGEKEKATEVLPVARLFLDISKTTSLSNKDKGDDEDN
jgi:hypothetical protein